MRIHTIVALCMFSAPYSFENSAGELEQASDGFSEQQRCVLQGNRFDIAHRFDISQRDLHLLDPWAPVPFPTSFMLRKNAIVANLGAVRALISRSEVRPAQSLVPVCMRFAARHAVITTLTLWWCPAITQHTRHWMCLAFSLRHHCNSS